MLLFRSTVSPSKKQTNKFGTNGATKFAENGGNVFRLHFWWGKRINHVM